MTAPLPRPDPWWRTGPFRTGETAEEEALRRDAGEILRAALEAVDPGRLVTFAMHRHARFFSGVKRVHVLAAGKAAHAMVRGMSRGLALPISSGLVISAEAGGPVPAGCEVMIGAHPVPDAASARAGQRVARFAEDIREGDVVLALISGGASALVALPPAGVPLDDVRAINEELLRSGASIAELNAVRKHLDQLKGGGLARRLSGCRALVLSLSDVPGDAPDVIASGPFSPDPTTYADAIDVLARHHVEVPESVRAHLERGTGGVHEETPKAGDPCFEGVVYEVIGSAATAAEAARAAAHERGYAAHVLTTTLTGEAREAGAMLAALIPELSATRAARIAAGETTVTVRGNGKGGRNQEVALSAALSLDGARGALVASLGSDGVDGPTDAAGAVVTGTTLRRARARGIDAARALEDNDSYTFLDALGDLIRTGPTGTNVMDIQIVLTRPV